MNYIQVKNLSKSYSDIDALNNLSMGIDAGILFGILGPNGAGKSTLIKILATLVEPDSGEVFINNINLIKNPRKIRELIGYVAQDIALDKILTGRELLHFQSDLYHMKKQEKYERIKTLINQLEMNAWIDRKCGTYSGGMKRRIDLAAGLLHLPKVLILDEPTSALDVIVQSKVLNLLLDIKEKLSLTYIFITHDLSVVKNIANKVLVMNKGKIDEFGKTKEVFSNPKSNYTKTLIRAIPTVTDEEDEIKPKL